MSTGLDLNAICDGLATVIRNAVPDLHVYANDPWVGGGTQNFPCAVIRLAEIAYHKTFEPSADVAWSVELRAAGFGVSDQRTLKELLSSGINQRSVVDAIEDDVSGFAGTVDSGSVVVTSSTPPLRVEPGDGTSWQQASLLGKASRLR